MPDAVFKDLCLDVVDLPTATAFYADLLGLTPDPVRARLDGERPEHAVWLNVVPEPRTVKNRVHVDVHATDLDDLLTLGARVDTVHPGWTVLRDPEEQEFCAFWRPEASAYPLFELVVDAAAPEPVARWWADRFGAELHHDVDDPWWWLNGGESALPWDLVFNPVPEPKTMKNRVHWDVWGESEVLVAAGATWVRRRDARSGGTCSPTPRATSSACSPAPPESTPARTGIPQPDPIDLRPSQEARRRHVVRQAAELDL